LFGVTRWDTAETLAPNWNTAPTDNVWAVLERVDRDTGELSRQLRPLRWGLVPSWAKDPGIGSRMINARAETVDTKPAFLKAFVSRRCLLPADGFYEWVAIPAAEGKKGFKQSYFIAPADGSLLAMAGLYEFWRDHTRPEDDPLAWLTTTTIITTQATDAAGRIHDRMPLAIDPISTPGSTPNTPTPASSASCSTPPPEATSRSGRCPPPSTTSAPTDPSCWTRSATQPRRRATARSCQLREEAARRPPLQASSRRGPPRPATPPPTKPEQPGGPGCRAVRLGRGSAQRSPGGQ